MMLTYVQLAQTLPLSPDDQSALGTLGLITSDETGGGTSLLFMALYLLFFITALAIVMAGVVWLTAGQNEERAARAKVTIVVAAIGLVVELGLWAILTAVSGTGKNTPIINVQDSMM